MGLDLVLNSKRKSDLVLMLVVDVECVMTLEYIY